MPARPTAAPSTRRPRAARRLAWWLLMLAVVLGHAVSALWLQDRLAGWGAAADVMPPRLEVAFVRALAPAAPPAAQPAVSRRTARQRLRPPRAAAPAASAVDRAQAVPEPAALAQPAVEPQQPAPVADAASVPSPTADAASAPREAAAASSPAPAFEWPPSTRLSYVLSGNYRGELHGAARVQWVRQGSRYQVHLDIAIGPGFAPLISRRMTSDGELGEQGLAPQRYDEATRLPFQHARHATIVFTAAEVTLADGNALPALPGVQDSASQFVQLSWLFTTQPELLRAGNTVTMPLALPRRMGRWVYDVLGQERLATPVGDLDTFHLKPRLGEQRPGSELSAEVWFAPTLQYLPVRIRIQQDADNFIDLLLDSAPLQVAPDVAPR
jgi:hypothetical protein